MAVFQLWQLTLANFVQTIDTVVDIQGIQLFRDRSNPWEDLPEEEVFRMYRFRPCTIVYILQNIPDIAAKTQRNTPLTPLLQLLIYLRFIATGGHTYSHPRHDRNVDIHCRSMHQKSFDNDMWRRIQAINSLSNWSACSRCKDSIRQNCR